MTPDRRALADEPLSRRALLGRGAALAGTALAAGPLAACGGSSSRSAQGRRIAVVGAGLAGLTCAYRLHQAGVAADVYEAHPARVGGRCWTARDFADGQTGEHGGEFIDSDHAHMRRLVDELGLRLEDRARYEARAGRWLLFLDGRLRKPSSVYRGYGATLRRLRAVERRTGYQRSYSNAAARAFDRRSVGEWIARNVPRRRSQLRELMREYFSQEFGLDAGQLTATDLLYLVEGPDHGEEPAASDPSDERYHVEGGNDLVTRGLAERLPDDAIHLDAPLTALWRRADGSYGLRFDDASEDVVADRVVLAIPFTTLREVDLSRAGFSPPKRRCIDELGMGTNAKVLLQFRHRPEHFHHWSGELVTDQPELATWESSLGQPGRAGLITVYSGGKVGAGYPADPPHGPAPPRVVRDTLAALDRVVPGLAADFNGRAWLDNWSADPWARGSYAAYLPGQYNAFYGVTRAAQGGVHFAGEHTAGAYQGFLEGAVASGDRCAREVLRTT